MNYLEFIAMLVNAGYEPRSYSGRGMYGRSCVGIVTDDQGFEVGLKCAQALWNTFLEGEGYSDNNPPTTPDDVMEFIQGNISSDSMGLSSIIYFPEVNWEESESNEEDN